MTPAEAIDVLTGALGLGLLMGGLSFVLFFTLFRVGFIHVVLGNNMAWSVQLLPVLMGIFLLWQMYSYAWPLSGALEVVGALILVAVTLAVLVMTAIPVGRLVDMPRAESTVSLNRWSAALALPYVGAWFAMSVILRLQPS